MMIFFNFNDFIYTHTAEDQTKMYLMEELFLH